MVQVNDTLWVDDTEITNNEYHQFLQQLTGEERKQYYPDTTLWQQEVPLGEPLTNYYFLHPAYDDYPVVGISHEAAVAFCKWRTRFFVETNNQHILFRLPTEDEWEQMAALDPEMTGPYAGGYSHPTNPSTKQEMKFVNKKKNKDIPLFNYGPISEEIYGGFVFTNSTKANFPSAGIYGLSGNVAEMVTQKSIAKGGSYFHELKACEPARSVAYDGPKIWLGFRCIAVVKGN